jgi:hypothetical protein
VEVAAAIPVKLQPVKLWCAWSAMMCDAFTLASPRQSKHQLKLTELIEREFGGFVPPKMFDE